MGSHSATPAHEQLRQTARFTPVLLVAMLLSIQGACSNLRIVDHRELVAIQQLLIAQSTQFVASQHLDRLRHEEMISIQQQHIQRIFDKLHARPETHACDLEALLGQEGAGDRPEGQLVIGAVEPVYLHIPGIVLPARIDTGAATSSLHALNIETFERDGQSWVRFRVPTSDSDVATRVERPVARRIVVTQASSEARESRAVVTLPVTLGRISQTAEFSLTDRGHLEYPVLIGRNILRDLMIVDVSHFRLTEPVTEPTTTWKEVDTR